MPAIWAVKVGTLTLTYPVPTGRHLAQPEPLRVRRRHLPGGEAIHRAAHRRRAAPPRHLLLQVRLRCPGLRPAVEARRQDAQEPIPPGQVLPAAQEERRGGDHPLVRMRRPGERQPLRGGGTLRPSDAVRAVRPERAMLPRQRVRPTRPQARVV